MTVTHGSYINQILSLNNNSANVRLYTRNITKGSSWSSTNSTYGTWTSLIDGSTYADYSG